MDRVFETKDDQGQKIKLRILEPNYEINRLCEIEYKKAWTFFLEQGVKTRAKIEKSLQEAGVWTEKEEESLKECETKAAIYLMTMRENIKNNKLPEARQAALKLREARELAAELNTIKQIGLSYSCEGAALEVKAEAYVAFSTVYEDDHSKKYWKNYKDFTERREEIAAIDALELYTKMLTEDHFELLKSYPENKFLIEQGVYTEDLKPNLSHLVKSSTKSKTTSKKTPKKKKATRKKKVIRKK